MSTRAANFRVALAIVTASLVTGCLGTGEDRILTIEATGIVDGLVYVDVDGNRLPDATDPPLRLVGVRLLAFGTPDTISGALSDLSGVFVMPAVPVGLFEMVVDPATVPDSLQVVDIEPSEFLVEDSATVTALVTVSFPIVTVEEARQLPLGEKVFVEGIALNDLQTFGDQTLHIRGDSLAIRVTEVSTATIFPGDSLRLRGTISALDGQPTMDLARPFLLSITPPPTPIQVTSAEAAVADGGRLDADLIQVMDATISLAARVTDGLLLNVDDGSGSLDVLLDDDVGFTNPDSIYVAGTVIDATGLLVPAPSTPGTWQLKPRSDADLTVK